MPHRTRATSVPPQAATQPELAKHITRYAERARKTAKGGSHLCRPIPDCHELGQADSFTSLMSWGIFNPFGPSISSLFLLPVPDGSSSLLFLRLLNPFFPAAIVYGLLPRQVAETSERLFGVLRELFTDNGSPEYPLLVSMPSLVMDAVPGSPLSPEQTKALFQMISRNPAVLADLGAECDPIERHWCDPWGRVSEASAEVFAQLKDIAKGSGASRESGADAVPRPHTQQEFDRWWDLVTDPQHAAAEMEAIQEAWVQSQRFVQGQE